MKKAEYYITDGNNFVKQSINGQFSKVGNIAVADVWDKAQVAKAVLDNSVPRAWRTTFYIAKCENGMLEKQTLSQVEKIQRRNDVLPPKDETKGYNLNLYIFDEDSSIKEVVGTFENMRNILENSKVVEEELKNRLQLLECAFEDLKHYHLKKKLGTVDAYKRDRLESKILLERRSVKNRLDIIQKINQHQSNMSNQIKDVCKMIDAIRNRKYVPRVLHDLFENDNFDTEF